MKSKPIFNKGAIKSIHWIGYRILFHPVVTCSKFEWNHKAQVFVSWVSHSGQGERRRSEKLIENPSRNATEPFKDRQQQQPGRKSPAK